MSGSQIDGGAVPYYGRTPPMLETVSAFEAVKRSFLFESETLRFSSPLLSVIARSCAADEEMLELGTHARPGQPIGIFIMLAAQFLLLKHPTAPLARYFPSLTPAPEPKEEAFPAFKQFCLERRDELLPLLASRTVNTNLVERASTILPALAHVASITGEPLTLVEICCSSGLSLLFDEYYYDYGAAGAVGNPSASVKLSGCKLIGGIRPPVSVIPQVSKRIGVDLVTIDTTDAMERLWMEAMLCPEWVRERENLHKALEFRASRPLATRTGNALEVLPGLLDELSGPVVVFHSYCMGQWSMAAKGALDRLFREASRRRDVHRLGFEVPDEETPEEVRARFITLSSARIPIQQKCIPARIEHTQYSEGDGRTRVLANVDGFGAWLQWLASS